jgi:hypothetical protein
MEEQVGIEYSLYHTNASGHPPYRSKTSNVEERACRCRLSDLPMQLQIAQLNTQLMNDRDRKNYLSLYGLCYQQSSVPQSETTLQIAAI